ncbi:MAG TPA: hypothetical protein DIU15_13635 [Deltaproteobacteria bacterium]|nr:hypothetical protein [Deltaproteobacteria bacterium]HCP47082.1 hypothetical protein [Deltaproteobacteria bacterium]
MQGSEASKRRCLMLGWGTFVLAVGLVLGACSSEEPGSERLAVAAGQEKDNEGQAAEGGDVAEVADPGVRARLTVVYTNNVDGEIEPCG